RTLPALLFVASLLVGCAVADEPCDNTCALPGIEQICASGGIATCTEVADGCLHYGMPRPCAEGRTCSQPGDGEAVCIAACPFSCVVGTTTCNGNLVQT